MDNIYLSDEEILSMDARQLLNAAAISFDYDELERIRTQALIKLRAKDLDCEKTIGELLRAYNRIEKQNADRYTLENAVRRADYPLAYDGRGTPIASIDNFLLIMRVDPHYASIRFNLLSNSPEITENGKIRRFSDADEAESRRYIEKEFGIHSEAKHYDALRILFRERQYHPVRDLIEGLVWDGEPRVENFLSEWMGAEDTPYTREVCRLIFSGGIHRAFDPGCKFDDVPVLIGTAQGEGKSTLVRWLAMRDAFFSEVTEIDGQKGIEQLEGAWICEIGELLALTRAKEQEAVKSYISRQKDKYRRPWDKQVSEIPRQCVFIGTTNLETFLKDKTGNRRFYPVKIRSSGYALFDREAECRAYIAQCWAEAYARYLRGELPANADRTLLEDFRAHQADAMEDDWRVGAIETWLARKPVGTLVCVRQIKREALCDPDRPVDPTPKESQEISVILSKNSEWEVAGRAYLPGYGRQRCYKRVYGNVSYTTAADDLPI